MDGHQISVQSQMKTQNTPTLKAKVKNIPRIFEDSGFNNFRERTPRCKSAKDKCLAFAKGELDKQFLILCGNVGNGKTHLAIATLKNLIPVNQQNAICEIRPATGIVLIADEFFQELNDSFIQRISKLQIIKEYLQNNDVVCLDDLGVKNFTEAKRENLYLLINRAYLDKRKMIITTNFILEQIETIDERISSRLSENGEILYFKDEDYRLLK